MRNKEIEKLHHEISGEKSCFTARVLRNYLGKDVSTDMFPSIVYFSDMLNAFSSELTRLQDQEEFLKYQIEQFNQKKTVHSELFKESSSSERYNSSGVMLDSHLDLLVEQACNLPAMNTNNTADPFFLVRFDNRVIHKSPVIPNTANPLWREKISLPITSLSHSIEIEVWDDDRNPELIGSFSIEQDSYKDQLVHSR